MTEQTTAAALTQLVAMKFRFRKDSNGMQRTAMEFDVPVPTAEGVISHLREGGKEAKLVLDAVYDVVRAALLNEVNSDITFDPKSYDFKKVSWTAIANMERAERATIADEQWEAWAGDFLAVMPTVSKKLPEQLANILALFRKKLVPVKTRKDLLAKLKLELELYVNSSQRAEEFADILELLVNRIDTYLKADDINALVENLGL
jgi:hypothetical protein